MKIKLVVIDLELSRRARRFATFGAVGALALSAAAIAYAGVPHTWNDGETLTAADLNSNFAALDSRVAMVTAWASYTSTVTANGTDVGGSQTTTAFWRRVGDTVEVRFVTVFLSCPFAGTLEWPLPPNVQFDTTKTAPSEAIGGGLAYGPGTNGLVKTIAATVVSTDKVAIDANGAPGGGAGCADVGSGGVYRVHFAAAVKGWNVTGP